MPYYYRKTQDQPLRHSGDEAVNEEHDLSEQRAQMPWGRTYNGKHRSRHLVGDQISGDQWATETNAFVQAKRHKQPTPIVEGEAVKPKRAARKEPLNAEQLNEYSGWASGLSWREYTHFDWVDETWSDPSGS